MKRCRLQCALGLSLLIMSGFSSGSADAQPVPGDFDNDCDVDLADFGHFKSCALGPAVAQPDPACADALLDPDGDVDLDDFGIFQRCYSGESTPADPNCNGDCTGEACDCLCGQTKCGGRCTFTTHDNANCGFCGTVCPAGSGCVDGICWPDYGNCDPGDISSPCYCGPDHPSYPNCCVFSDCAGVCTNTGIDEANCGACGYTCAPGTTCANGACVEPCFGGQLLCDGVCREVQMDPSNCGGCGDVCDAGMNCVGGVCLPAE